MFNTNIKNIIHSVPKWEAAESTLILYTKYKDIHTTQIMVLLCNRFYNSESSKGVM